MSDPVFVVECPYCHALVPLFRDRLLVATCRACGQDMRMVYQGWEGYEEVARDYAVLSRIKEVKKER